jgi:hypothetical protein
MAMLQSLFGAIAETFLISTWRAMLEFFGWERLPNARERRSPHLYRDWLHDGRAGLLKTVGTP